MNTGFPLKIRVWDAHAKEFFYNHAAMFVRLDGTPVWYQKLAKPSNNIDIHCEWPEHLIPQRCVGVKDKNKQEIFEGDIIEGRTFYYDNKIDDLVFSEVCRGHVWYINGSWNVSFNHLYSESSCHLEKFDLYSTEIIGNIFENPELIK